MKWINTKEQLPDKGEYVLLETTYCKYPCIVGFYNGVEFRDADNKSEIVNTNHWCKIVPKLKVGQKLKAISEGRMYYDEQPALIIGKEYEINHIDENVYDGVYVEICSEICNEHCYPIHNLYECFEIKKNKQHEKSNSKYLKKRR